MTYPDLVSRLRLAGIDNPEWDAALLLEWFAHADRHTLPLDPSRDYPASDALIRAVDARVNREPLQYLLGEWEFYRQTYEVTPDCLIPRPDTEILVEEAIRNLPPNSAFLDLCTGSGCVAVSTLAERPDTTAVAVDLFPETLRIAAKNAAKNGVSDRFTPLVGDVLHPIPELDGKRFDAILSNPPYIASDEVDTLSPEVQKEPRAALDGGADGLDFYRAILKNCTRLLKPNGFFLFEIGAGQAEDLRRLAEKAGFRNVTVRRDYGGHDRTVFLSDFSA